MFEGLIEKLLQEKLGKFVDGIDKDNLSIGVSSFLMNEFSDMEWKRSTRKSGSPKEHFLVPWPAVLFEI
jgi:hypothetical protein